MPPADNRVQHMATISKVKAREILDSRGNPTIEVDVTLSDEAQGRASVPSGASTGSNEALELRDGDPTRFRGMGVLEAIRNVHEEIAPEVLGHSALDQEAIDSILADLDGTQNKGKLGANAVLGVSIAVARAAAQSERKPFYEYLSRGGPLTLPVPMFNIINGGRHAENSTDFQEFMVVPVGFDTFREALRAGAEIYRALEDLLRARRVSTSLGDEGGFAPPVSSNHEALELALAAIETAGYLPGTQCLLALDIAASELVLEDGRYSLLREGRILNPDALMKTYEEWVAQYPIISIEDGMAEQDWGNWQSMTSMLGEKVQVVGDDLYATNAALIREGIERKAANAVLIKANQIGTITETLEAIDITKKAGWNTIISHRSGETSDDSIADLAVGTSAGQIKAGAPARGERIAKYNRLLRIEEELGDRAFFFKGNVYERFANGR